MTPLALLVAAQPAQAAPFCIPEAPVCAGLDNGRFVFTVQPAPATLSVSATANGAPATGSMSYVTGPGYLRGWYQPFPPLVSGDVMCMSFYGMGVPPGPYCDTAP
ncbi:hypothetical protein ACBJ59_15650 [Nonomuraea sp. MTCD27]|uniref:hypothetical protein n=1 Tax=Nonomuraea sp. MTCD27 TaxID=1676747 RepID=UPI0035C1E210